MASSTNFLSARAVLAAALTIGAASLPVAAPALSSVDGAYLAQAQRTEAVHLAVARLARDRSTGIGVRDVAARLASEADRFSAAARLDGVPATTPTAKESHDLASFGRGPAFDQAFAHDVRNDLRTTVGRARLEEAQGSDPRVRALASAQRRAAEASLAIVRRIGDGAGEDGIAIGEAP